MSYLGTTKIGKMFLGTVEIAKAYLGDDLVFQNGPVLPDGPVDWIETDGVAFIDTGIVGAWPKSCEVKALFIDTDFAVLLGARKANEGQRFQPIMSNNNRVDFGIVNSYYSGVSIEASITNQTPVYVRAMAKNSAGSFIEAKQDGESGYTRKTYDAYPGGSNPSTGLNLFLFANNYGGVAANIQPAGTRLYYCKIYSDVSFSTLVFDGTPCRYRGKYGLWDSVSDSFFGNAAGSGAFTGPSPSNE